MTELADQTREEDAADYLYGWPMRCRTDVADAWDGECLACGAASGEQCRALAASEGEEG